MIKSELINGCGKSGALNFFMLESEGSRKSASIKWLTSIITSGQKMPAENYTPVTFVAFSTNFAKRDSILSNQERKEIPQ